MVISGGTQVEVVLNAATRKTGLRFKTIESTVLINLLPLIEC